MLIRILSLILISASVLTACKTTNNGFNKQKYTKLKKIKTEEINVEKTETTSDDIVPYKGDQDIVDSTFNEDQNIQGIEQAFKHELACSSDKIDEHESHKRNLDWDDISTGDKSINEPLDVTIQVAKHSNHKKTINKPAIKIWGFWILLFGTIVLVILFLIESKHGHNGNRGGFVAAYLTVLLTSIIASTIFFIVGSKRKNRSQSSFNVGRFWLIVFLFFLSFFAIIGALISAFAASELGTPVFLSVSGAVVGIALAVFCVFAAIRLIKYGKLRKR